MISIDTFPKYFVPNPIVSLPERDVFGVLHGRAYVPTYGPEHSKTAMAGCEYDVKTGGQTVFHSLLEAALDLKLALSPYVIEARPHYPMSLDKRVKRRLGFGERLLTSELPTIDRVLTLQSRDDGSLHLHGISVKPEDQLRDDAVTRRHKREELYMASRGGSSIHPR
ncbi:hypothetical protein BJN34_22690 [Cupriavidus necator]|uniref:Uncharacterized protein n=1 Tax=Cupriavidus necator TaxID=106590 RepID=A0A1U9UX37_CUPNE|nr:hypothetical protein [Cupriavidus necator]AQV96675.1 hypothetical protein BJN34_22690 [Cupriavidus necator]